MRLAFLSATLLAAACSTETGVLIEISQHEPAAAVDHLQVYVGQGSLERFETYFADSDPEQDIDVAGRDLTSDPYRLMLRPGERDMEMMVVVLGYAGADVVAFGALDQPVPFVDGKVTEWPVVLRSEIPDGFGIYENGCLVYIDDSGRFVKIGRPGDLDCDGWAADSDCNDLAPDINPGSTDVCGNAIDEDCDEAIDENVDDDQDSVTTCDGDCDDQNNKVFPGAPEVCDGHDNDCNALCDDGQDGDGDRYTACGSYLLDDGSCEFDDSRIDCDDQNSNVHPSADEKCDGIDNDCNGVCEDADAGLDPDGDGFTACGTIVGFCGQSDEYIDCEPDNGVIHPAALELCNGGDDNCDDMLLASERCFVVNSDDGTCYQGVRECNDLDATRGQCLIAANEVEAAPADACIDYDICVESGDPAPYQCALEDVEATDINCAVNMLVSSGQQCGGPSVILPTDNLEVCSWRIVVQDDSSGDYLVGLRPVGQPTAPLARDLAVCDVSLSVSAITSTPAPESLLLIRESDLNGSETLVIHLGALPTDTCVPPLGLECDGLVNTEMADI